MLDAEETVVSLPPVSWATGGVASLEQLFGSGLLETIPLRVAVISAKRHYLYLNRESIEFWGRPNEQFVGVRIATLWGAQLENAFCDRTFDRVLAGETLRRSGWRVFPGGSPRYIQETMVPFAPSDGEVEAVVILVRDDTLLKHGEAELANKKEELRASEALKSAIFDHALVGLVSADTEGLIVEFNPRAEEMFSRSRADALGQSFSDLLLPHRFREASLAGMAQLMENGHEHGIGRRLTIQGKRADDTEFPIEMALWRTQLHRSAFYTASIIDMTQRHDAERQIEHQREALRRGEKLSAMGRLLADVAHELNSPLAIAMGRASLLEEECAGTPGLQSSARRIREATERCGRIVRTFLNMARMQPGRRDSVNLNQVLLGVVEMLQHTYGTHGVELERQLMADLPPVMADADQLSQIVMNLMVNAQQALSEQAGHRRVRISTGIHRPDDVSQRARVWLRVADNGPGVAPRLKSSIFEAFVTSKPAGIGTGLGLSIAHSLARDNEGELALEDIGGQGGATFCLSLPAGADIQTASNDAPSARSDAASNVARVLVVDDEPELAALIREMLEGAGYEVCTAQSAAAGLEQLGDSSFCAIVSELRMPEIDGSSFWRSVKAQYPRLAQRMLFMTGDTLSPNVSAFVATSGCPCLDKPFSKTELLSALLPLIGPTSD